jgi:peptidoglycan/xylan/chitin deacetylase (PgdA/CDA1 family)
MPEINKAYKKLRGGIIFIPSAQKWLLAAVLLAAAALAACSGHNLPAGIPSTSENAAVQEYAPQQLQQPTKPVTEPLAGSPSDIAGVISTAEASEGQKNETTRPPMAALTFDDGPSAYTNRILDLLEHYGGRSTFFVSGPRMLAGADTVMRAFDMGNEIANHSWSHQDMRFQSDEEIVYEIQRASAAIASVTGISPPIFRPPFGMADERVADIAAGLGYSIIKWTVDPLDWRYRDADTVYRSIMSQVENDSIILVHDTRPTTAAAMERVIPQLIERGFQLVTVSELIYSIYGSLEPGRIYGTYTILD